MTWTRISDPDEAAARLPAWLGRRLIGLRGRFGLLLTTGDVLRITSIAALHQSIGDVLRITSIAALHQSTGGIALLDVLLDHAGVPDGVDLAWQPKHYLGAPVPGATAATVNLAHVVAAIEFVAEAPSESPGDANVPAAYAAEPDFARIGSLSETIERANDLTDG